MGVCAASNSPSNYLFNYSTAPFTFAVARSDSNGEALFNTVGQRFIFKVCGMLPSLITASLPLVSYDMVHCVKHLRWAFVSTQCLAWPDMH